MKTTFFAKANSNGKRGELWVYDAIGASFFSDGITPTSVKDALEQLKGSNGLDIYINSPGGSVFDGITIYNMLKRFPGDKVVHIDGLAASIASIIAMVGDSIVIAENALMMIHDPMGMAMGSSSDMRKMADTMDKVREVLVSTYVNRTGAKEKDISDWMTAETWMDSAQCVERGFAQTVSADQAVKAEFPSMLAQFHNVPEQLKKQASTPHAALARMQVRTLHLNPGAGPRTA